MAMVTEFTVNWINAFVVFLILSINALTYYFAAERTDRKVKQSEDKIWEYMKLVNKTEPAETKSGLTRKF